MEKGKVFDYNRSMTADAFCKEAQKAAKAFLAYQKQLKEAEACTADLTNIITKNEENFISNTKTKIKNEAYSIYGSKKRIPIILGLIVYVVGVIICSIAAGYMEIYDFWPALFFIGLCVFRLTEIYEDLDDIGKIANVIVSVIAIGCDCFLINNLRFWEALAKQDTPIDFIFIAFCIISRIIADIVPIIRKVLLAIYIKRENKKVISTQKYAEGLANARASDLRLTENSQKKAKKRLEELMNRDTDAKINYDYYKDFCQMMLHHIKGSHGYDFTQPDLYQTDYDTMIAVIEVCRKSHIDEIFLDEKNEHHPENLFIQALYKYNAQREHMNQTIDDIMDKLNKL